MFTLLHPLFALLQPEATSSSTGAATTAVAKGTPSFMDGGFGQFGMLAVTMVVFYLVLMRPQQKKQKELDGVLKSLKKGQRVRTSSGIRGEIVDFKSEVGDEVVLLLAERVKVNILRSHIAGVIDQAEGEPKS